MTNFIDNFQIKYYGVTQSVPHVTGFISALVPSWGWYATARVVVGIGFGANMVINCVYPLEFVSRQWRVLCGTIGLWSIGSMILAGFVSIYGMTAVLHLSV